MRRSIQLSIFFFFCCCAGVSWARVPRHLKADAVKNLARLPTENKACERFAPGSIVTEPKNLFSQAGTLTVTLNYESSVNADGNVEYCYRTPEGQRSPTLHLKPGETLVLNLINKTPAPSGVEAMAGHMMLNKNEACGPGLMMDSSSTNLHFHGTNVSPTCHQDESLKTLVNSGQSFTYQVHFPKDEPPGLYWYHPHIHGTSEAALLGGASGAIIIEGIQQVQKKTGGLSERGLVFRDNLIPTNPKPGGLIPSWDLSLNFIPIPYPKYPPAIIQMKPQSRELWRVLNASADTILDLQLSYDGVPQSLAVVGLDGVPTDSESGQLLGHEILRKHIFLSPAARAEFIVEAPGKNITRAELSTLAIDTGPAGDSDPARNLAIIESRPVAVQPSVVLAKDFHFPSLPRFKKVLKEKIKTKRKIYFSEVISNPADPSSPTDFFITEDKPAVKPQKFTMDLPPAIVTTQGQIEEWTVENRSTESHEFHIHQIHFLLMKRNGIPVDASDQQFLDIIEVPYWSGQAKDPYPSVTLRIDFSGDIVGDFVYHCHIIGHEDNGMMAKIRVLPKKK